MIKKELVIVGTGGFAREVHQIVEDLNQNALAWDFLGFVDGNPERHGLLVHGYPVLGGLDWLELHPDVHVVVAVGNPATRRKVVRQISAGPRNRFATLVHPLAWIGNRVQVGVGSVICAGTLITTDVVIGSHVILNLDCTVGHDTSISDFVTVAPGVHVSGNVQIHEGCDIGTGAAIIQGITIGRWTIVGAGAVVVKDLPANVTALGVPAQVMKERPEGWHEG